MRAAAFVFTLLAISSPPALGQDFMVQFELRGRTIEGGPLAFSEERVELLGRDGHWWQFAPAEAIEFRKTSGGFHSFSPREMRGELLREFGRGFDVSGTGHYLVVHPAGQRDAWAARFEDLYRGFVHYFSARGLAPQSPRFPLVAIVFATQADFLRHAARDGAPVSSDLLGYYSPTTNRISLYDVTAGRDDADWKTNAATIIHEAAHQMAFNTGVHNRFAAPPRWVAEGLGTMFEARGVWDSRDNTKPADRVNFSRLAAFQNYVATNRKSGSLAEFLSSDRLFESNPQSAYAEAWALSFFLAETEPRKYAAYLQRTASRPNFVPYPATDRLQDFSATFGENLAMLEARFLRFMTEIK